VHIFEVSPVAVGWVVKGCGEPLFFHSGGAAERTARKVAAALAARQSVELRISDRTGRVASSLRWSPSEKAPPMPHLAEVTSAAAPNDALGRQSRPVLEGRQGARPWSVDARPGRIAPPPIPSLPVRALA
jgi:hypothetical protein